MVTDNMTFRRMTIRDAEGKVISENIVAVDRDEINSDASVKSYMNVGAVDYSENSDSLFRTYTNSEKSTYGYGSSVRVVDAESMKKNGYSASFTNISCEDMKNALKSFNEAYPNVKVPTNSQFTEMLLSDTDMMVNSVYSDSMKISKEEAAEKYDNLKKRYEVNGLSIYGDVGSRNIEFYDTLSAFDKDFADYACMTQAAATHSSVIMAADRYGFIKTPAKVDGFELTGIDRAYTDATGVSLTHAIGENTSDGFLVAVDENGEYHAESTKYTDKMSQKGWNYRDSISNNLAMTAVKAKTLANIASHNISMTASQIKDTCKTGWKNYCNNVKRNYNNVKDGLIIAGSYLKGKAVAGAKTAYEVGKAVGGATIMAGAATVKGAQYVGTKAVEGAKYVGEKTVELKDATINGAKNFASGVKNSVVSKYNTFKNFLSDTYDRANDGVNRGIVNISDKFIRGVQGIRDSAERRIKRSNNQVDVNRVTMQGAELNQAANAQQQERVAE